MTKRPKCTVCGSVDLEGPYEAVYFCNGCGRTVRPGETPADIRARDARDRQRAYRQPRESTSRGRA